VTSNTESAAPLELDRTSRIYPGGGGDVAALVDVSLEVERGEFVSIMGPSGSGKSTLLSLAGGLETPSSGEVRIDGIDLSTLSKRKLAEVRLHRVGYVFQDFNLLPALTAVENVAMPLELAGMGRRSAERVASDQLDAVGLAERLSHFPDDLSGGERQRVAIARALIGDSQLILADEPTGALDSVMGEAVMRTLRQACERGASAVVVTHDAQLAAWADRVVFLRDGRVVDHTEPPSLAVEGSLA
jgi:putative ABC transport system ATP-binding protein